MLIHSANLSIIDYNNNMDKSILDIYNFLVEFRVLKADSCEKSFNENLNVFNLFISNNNEESWILRKKFNSEINFNISLDIVRENFKEKVCLKQDVDFISILLKNKLISSAYFHLGLPQKKKHFFSSKFSESNFMGFEHALFLSLFKSKYVYNWDLLDKYHKKIKTIINNHWKDLKKENQIITLKRSEFDTFFKNIETPFSKELMQLVNK